MKVLFVFKFEENTGRGEKRTMKGKEKTDVRGRIQTQVRQTPSSFKNALQLASLG